MFGPFFNSAEQPHQVPDERLFPIVGMAHAVDLADPIQSSAEIIGQTPVRTLIDFDSYLQSLRLENRQEKPGSADEDRRLPLGFYADDEEAYVNPQVIKGVISLARAHHDALDLSWLARKGLVAANVAFGFVGSAALFPVALKAGAAVEDVSQPLARVVEFSVPAAPLLVTFKIPVHTWRLAKALDARRGARMLAAGSQPEEH